MVQGDEAFERVRLLEAGRCGSFVRSCPSPYLKTVSTT